MLHYFKRFQRTKQLADEWRAAMKKNMKVTESTPKPRALSPEPDTEKMIWPSAVPAYLLYRKDYYFIPLEKKRQRWWEEKEKPKPPKREWWHDITHQSRQARQQAIAKNDKEESSSDPEVIDEPPDPPDRR